MKVSKQAIVNYALKTVQNSDNQYKERWLKAIETASGFFLSSDQMVSYDVHTRIEQYQTTIHTCGCKAATTGNPCYHRAYVLLQLRHAEVNGEQ